MPGRDAEITLLLSAGWTWIGPTEADGAFELRAAELTDFLVVGPTREEVYAELPEALRAYFASFEDRPLPVPPPRWVPRLREHRYVPTRLRTETPAASLGPTPLNLQLV